MLEIKNLTIVPAENGNSLVPLVQGVSFSLGAGRIHILLGANGSGKSSLVNGIFSHPKYKISDGQILLDGEDITALSPDKKAKKGLFLSLQHIPEIDGVSFFNFLYRAYREMKHVPELSPMDFKKIADEKAAECGMGADFFRREVNAGLSGGEKKKSEAFQLALFEPRFAVLDEIDSGVDRDAMESVFAIIEKQRKRGTGFLLITHYANILERISPETIGTVLVMKEGRIARAGGKEVAQEIADRGFEEIEK